MITATNQGARLASIRRVAVRAGRTVLDLVYPRLCPLCSGAPGSVDDGGLCTACQTQVPLFTPPLCGLCGGAIGQSVLATCGECARLGRPWRSGSTAWHYDQAARTLVLAFKYRKRLTLAPVLGRALTDAWRERLPHHDQEVIVPVPLFWLKHALRGYNQAELIGRELARATGLPLVPALARTRWTRPQARLSRHQRQRNLGGAFAVRDAASIAGRRVLLVDDVLTTGSTLRVCTRALLAAGAISVDVLTLARG